MMPESGRIRLVRPSAVIITHKKWVYRVTSYVEPRDTFGPYDFQK